jgi:hypothetical protein
MMTFPYIPRAWVRWRAGKRAPTVAAAAGTRILGAHHENERPPFTPAIWVLLWATFWAGVVEAYAVMGSYSFQALPGVANALAPGVRAHTRCHERVLASCTACIRGSNRHLQYLRTLAPQAPKGYGLWGAAALHPQQQHNASWPAAPSGRSLTVGVVAVAPSRLPALPTTISAADSKRGFSAGATQSLADAIYCSWSPPMTLSLIPQLTPILAALATAVIASRCGAGLPLLLLLPLPLLLPLLLLLLLLLLLH